MTRTLVLGATSTIARSMVRQLGARGHDLVLGARDEEELGAVVSDVRIRHGVEATGFAFDVQDTDHVPALQAALDQGPVDQAIACFGLLGDQAEARRDPALARRIIEVNLAGLASSLTVVAGHLEARGRGALTILSSVAGDRGRASNHTYGAAKAGVNALASGLRQRLHPHGVQVTTIKPGFVDTKMTYGREGMFLVASPERVARATLKAMDKGRDIVYVPWFWRPASWFLRALPEGVFKRLEL